MGAVGLMGGDGETTSSLISHVIHPGMRSAAFAEEDCQCLVNPGQRACERSPAGCATRPN